MVDSRLRDPLHEILERHLFRSSTENEASSHMVDLVVHDYLKYLSSQGVHIPTPFKDILVEDLKEEVRELTIRKTFGAVSIAAPEKKKVSNPQKKSA